MQATDFKSLSWLQSAHDQVLAQGQRLHHALLLQGGKGVGLPELALGLAQTLLCERPSAAGACGVCESCHLFASGNHPDLHIIVPSVKDSDDAASPAEEGAAPEVVWPSSHTPEITARGEIKVESIRQLISASTLGTTRGGRRVVVLYPAEALNAVSANALLKTLEEPPPGMLLLLATSEPGRLLPTIRSRCQVVNVPTPAANAPDVLAWLAGQGVQDAAAWLALARGAPYAALNLAAQAETLGITERLAAWCTPEDSRFWSSGNLKKGEIRAWLEWYYRFAAHCAELAAGGTKVTAWMGVSAAQWQAAAQRLSPAGWHKLLAAITRSLRAAEHPLAPALVTDSLLVHYSDLLAAEQGTQPARSAHHSVGRR
jgi:DNA polymerase-3 subunit delta'